MSAAEDLIAEAYAVRKSGDAAGGLRGYMAAVDALREMDEPLRLAHTVRHVADIQRGIGELEAARANYAEALAIYRAEPGTGKLDLANTLRGYGLLLEQMGENAAATAMWREAGALYAAVGVQVGVDEADRRVSLLNTD